MEENRRGEGRKAIPNDVGVKRKTAVVLIGMH